jgi:glucose/arabinose dehydrogenase
MRRALLCALILFAMPLLPSAPLRAAETLPETLDSFAGTLRLEVVASGLRYPWSMAFLPDGSMLVTEKHPGRLRRVAADGTVSAPLEGLPPIYAEGNGGLLGLVLDPAFTDTGRIFFAYSEPGAGEGEEQEAGLTVARAVLRDDRVSEVTVLFRQTPKVADVRNFGGRLAFAPDGTLFIATGDRFAQDGVQDLRTTLGKLVRITTEGEAPADNPFVNREDADPMIWSLGHRNGGGIAMHPDTGRPWMIELGPWGGDELNIPEAGGNYGWPLVSWGRHYEGQPIPAPSTRPDLSPSIFHWTPVISPSGMTFYDGTAIPDWRGNLVLGGLSSRSLTRLTLRGDRVVSDERIPVGVRIRDVNQGPDGALYLLTDQPDGKIVRLTLETPAGDR